MEYRLPCLTKADINRIHDASMDLLQNTGVAFHSEKARNVFKKHGFDVDGKVVHFKEAAVYKALESAPSQFVLQARNAERSVKIGGDSLALAPGYGAPYVITADGERRKSTLEDYRNFCRLVQSSTQIDVNGYMMVEPADIPAHTAYLDMVLANVLLCDKPFLSSAASGQAAQDCIDLIVRLFGGAEKVTGQPHTMALININSPLQFGSEMAEALMVYAHNGQVSVVASAVMAASSGPVNLAGVLALQNAEVLAGITLSQLVNPGAPAIYGATSMPMDMRTGGVAIGAPEMSQILAAAAQMARFYRLPSRSGGSLTDAHFPDAQAAVESTLTLHSAVLQGINFILHAGGILSSFMAMSFEKFLIDEEVATMVKKAVSPLTVTEDSIDVDTIKKVGIGGQFLTQPKTRECCWTEFFMPDLMRRSNYPKWQKNGKNRIDQVAAQALEKRLASVPEPSLDAALASDLTQHVAALKQTR